MGTYTTNYNLFLPSIGEQGWGDLVNGNFTTIDTAVKGLDTRIGTLETEMDTVEGRVTVLETGEFESVTTEIVKGDVRGLLFVPATLQENTGDVLYATCPGFSFDGNNGQSFTFDCTGYVIKPTFPIKHSLGVYTRDEDIVKTALPFITSRVCTIKNPHSGSNKITYRLSTDSTNSTRTLYGNGSFTVTVPVGVSLTAWANDPSGGYGISVDASVPAGGADYYIKYVTP